MSEVALIDLGLGNLRSVARALARAGAEPVMSSDPEVVRRATRLVVPGQGGFERGVAALSGELGAALRDAIDRGVPYLGLCLGMQLLFERSEEAPGAEGMGLFEGDVRRFDDGMTDPDTGDALKVPHMGWNLVHGNHPVVPEDGWFYFVHSYRCVPANRSDIAATASYPEPFCAAVARDNIVAVQFHPEKSQQEGVGLLARFLGDSWS